MYKRRTLSRLGKLTALTGAAVVMAASAAVAHVEPVDDGAIDDAKATHGGQDQEQHGGTDGHLPAKQQGPLDLVSKLPLKNVEPGKIADVGVLGDYAYLAAWGGETCTKNGTYVVNIADVANPKEVAFVPSKEGSYSGEGVQALSISTSAFTGDILVTNNETCKAGVGFGGINIYDISNPARPTPLAVGFGDDSEAVKSGKAKKNAHQTHSVFAWSTGTNAYAAMVDNEEAKDVDIVDITNPKKPVLIAEYDLAATFPQILQPDVGLDEVFLHDLVVKKIGDAFVMLASYWDGGYVKLDVTVPTNAVYLGDTDFTFPDPEAAESGLMVPPEGNAHQAEFTLDNQYVIGADEDFAPYALLASNVEDGSEIDAGQGSGTTQLTEGQTITGESVFFGRGCIGDPAAPAGDGTQIAVVERGLCTFTEKVASVEAVGGYAAVLIFNRTGTDGCDGSLGMSVEGDIPAFGVAPRGQGFAIFDQPYDNAACLAGTGAPALPVTPGTPGDELTFSSYFDGWGYVHLFGNTDGKMAELDTYAIPEAHDPAFATGFGDLSVHEVATSQVDASVGYLAYYAGGIRVIDTDGREITETAAFIDEGGSNFWGVEVFTKDGKEYLAASDRDLGLYIFEYTPVNTP